MFNWPCTGADVPDALTIRPCNGALPHEGWLNAQYSAQIPKTDVTIIAVLQYSKLRNTYSWVNLLPNSPPSWRTIWMLTWTAKLMPTSGKLWFTREWHRGLSVSAMHVWGSTVIPQRDAPNESSFHNKTCFETRCGAHGGNLKGTDCSFSTKLQLGHL